MFLAIFVLLTKLLFVNLGSFKWRIYWSELCHYILRQICRDRPNLFVDIPQILCRMFQIIGFDRGQAINDFL